MEQATSELDFSSSELPKMLSFISSALQRVTDSNDAHHRSNLQHVSVFDGLSCPAISIHSYLERIFQYANCSSSCFVVAYVYLDRFVQRQSTVAIDSWNVHRLVITSVLVAAKFMDDVYYNNAYYAKIGGISTAEMNFLEVDFLFGLRFQLNVTPNTFYTYCCYLRRQMMLLHPPAPLSSISIVSNDHRCSCPSSSMIMVGNLPVKHLQYSSCYNDDESCHQPHHQIPPHGVRKL
ncbi:Cyclin-U4-1-like protein [Drosera capensis]